MQRIQAKLSSKSQVTLPADVRKVLGVGPEDKVIFVVGDDGDVRLRRSDELTLEQLRGILPPLKQTPSPDFRDEIREAMDERAQEIVDRLNRR